MKWRQTIVLFITLWIIIQTYFILYRIRYTQSQNLNCATELSQNSTLSPLPPFIIITLKRQTSGFALLEQQLQSFEKEWGQLVPLDIHLLNVGQEPPTFLSTSLRLFIHNLHQFDYSFTREMSPDLNEKRRAQIKDFVKAIRYLQVHLDTIFSYANYFVLMEDDFAACPHSLFHIFALLKQMNTMTKSDIFFDVVRTSYGNSGLFIKRNHVHNLMDFFNQFLINLPIDALLEQYWLHTRRSIYIYKYQLFDHLGAAHSTVGNDHTIETNYPKCNEMQTANRMLYEWDLKECHGELLCKTLRTYTDLLNFEEDKKKHFVMEILPTSDYSILELQQMQIKVSQLGQSCSETCGTLTCDEKLFAYVNHCTVLRHYFGECDQCGYSYEYAPPTVPHFDGKQCSLSERAGKFDCLAKADHVKRLCICS